MLIEGVTNKPNVYINSELYFEPQGPIEQRGVGRKGERGWS